MGRVVGLFLCLAALAAGQDAAAHAARVRASMQASLNKQKAALTRQPARVVQFAPSVCAPIAAPALVAMIDAAAKRHDMDANVVREVARQESAFRPCAVSSKGAEGVMQLMPATQATLGVRNAFDPQESIEAGTRLLRQLLDRYQGDLSLALSAYNAGPARVDRVLGVPQIPETQNYVHGILERLAIPRQ